MAGHTRGDEHGPPPVWSSTSPTRTAAIVALARRAARAAGVAPVVGMVVVVGVAVLALAAQPAAATTGTDGAAETGGTAESEGVAESGIDEARDELLREGSQVYSQICSSCHQPGGVGLGDQYPPLLDNPNIDDSAYVADVIANGRRGELIVGGITYDGVMPSFSTLSDDDVEAVIAYLQADFAAPAAEQAAFDNPGPVAGTELPGLADASSILAFLLAAITVGMVLWPRLIAANDRFATPWLDVWLKTAAIVVAIVVAVVIIPDQVLQLESVADLDRSLQDLIGVALWAVGLVACLAALWYAHRESRV